MEDLIDQEQTLSTATYLILVFYYCILNSKANTLQLRTYARFSRNTH